MLTKSQYRCAVIMGTQQ